MSSRYAFFRGCFIPVRLPHIEYAAKLVLSNVDVELVDVKGFTCCPEPFGFSFDRKLAWLTIAARNICVAESNGLDILTLCNGCYYTVTHALEELKHKEMRDRVNDVLSVTGYEFKGAAKAKHFVEVLDGDVGERKLGQAVKSPLSALAVASHTGCHYANWFGVGSSVLDRLVSVLGARVVEYDLKNLCCGWSLMSYGSADAANSWLRDRLDSMKVAGADCSTVICPQCFYQFDMGQSIVSRKVGMQFKIPVLFYLQLLGLAMGYSLEEMQYPSHRVRDSAFETKLRRQ